MAEWNYTSMYHPYGLNNVPTYFQPQFCSSNNYLNQPVDMASSNPPLNYCHSGPHSAEWFQFQNLLSQGSSNTLGNSKTENLYVQQSILSEPQQKWLNMVNQKRLDQSFVDNFIQTRVLHRSRSRLVQVSKQNPFGSSKAFINAKLIS